MAGSSLSLFLSISFYFLSFSLLSPLSFLFSSFFYSALLPECLHEISDMLSRGEWE